MPSHTTDLRKAWDLPNLPVCIGVTGNWGWEMTELKENKDITDEQRKSYIDGLNTVIKAQLDVAKRPEFKGTVAAAETRDFWRPREQHGGRGTETHWMANGESYWLIGEAMGKAMVELLSK